MPEKIEDGQDEERSREERGEERREEERKREERSRGGPRSLGAARELGQLGLQQGGD